MSGDAAQDVVQAFAKAYGDKDLAGACSQVGPESAVFEVAQQMLDDVGTNRVALGQLESLTEAGQSSDAFCRKTLGLVHAWDPSPGSDLHVTDVDTTAQRAEVTTDAGTWRLIESNGHWKLSRISPIVPNDLQPATVSAEFLADCQSLGGSQTECVEAGKLNTSRGGSARMTENQWQCIQNGHSPKFCVEY